MRSRAMSIIHQMRRARQRASLFDQMRVSQDLKCFEPRDKVYALLGVVGRGHDDIIPDYEIGIPSLLNTVLRNHHKYRSPRDLLDVKRQCEELCEAVGVPAFSVYVLENQPNLQAPGTEDIGRSRFSHFESGLSLWWASLYGHYEVAKLLLAAMDGALLSEYVLRSAREGRIDAIQFWLRTHVRIIHYRDNRDRSLLSVATAHGHVALVELLLQDTDTDINSRDHHGKAAIHIAAAYGLTGVLTVLLKHATTNVNALDNDQYSPLHLAIKWDREHSIRLLLGRADLDMNLVSAYFQTPLEFAISRGQPDIVELLLERDDLDVAPDGSTSKRAVRLSAMFAKTHTLTIRHSVIRVEQESQ